MGDSYRPSRSRQYDDRRRGGDTGFSFRGAAADSNRDRPEERFTFNPPSGPSAPRFPAQQPPPRAPQSNRPGANKKRDRNGRGGRQGGQPFRRVPRPAHAREILSHKERETTPEQMVGMSNEGQARFVDNASDSEDGEVVEVDSDGNALSPEGGDDKESHDDNEGPSKRVKTDDGTAAPARPQWSNPDPYSVLPPTDLGLQPKKDIVKAIRKAKVDVSNQKADTNAIKENADFISFDFGEEKAGDDDDDDEMDEEVAPSVAPPVDLWMPTDMELAEMYSEPRGTKRKHVPEQSSHAGIIVSDWQENATDPTPWLRGDKEFMASRGLDRLHMEIVDFYNYVRPRTHEEDLRRDLIVRVEKAVRAWRGAIDHDVKIRPFGSFASDLYLPTGDMDLVAVSRNFEERGVAAFCLSRGSKMKLARHLEAWGIPKKNTMNPVVHARVPILKFVDAKTGIRVDISFESDSGVRAVQTLRDWKAQFPEMPALVMIIKQFLAMRGLNEVVSGGLGGFSIICLVVSMLQIMPENQRKTKDMQSRLGQLLCCFFDLYGNKFNLEQTGIRMQPPGYFDKTDRNACRAKINAKGLTILDPNKDDHDIAGGSKQVRQVFLCFRGAMYEIQKAMSRLDRTNTRNESILRCILGGDYTSFKTQRDKLANLDRTQNRRIQADNYPPSPRLAPPRPDPRDFDYPPSPRLAPRREAQGFDYPPSPRLARAPQPDYYHPPPPPSQYPQYPSQQPWQQPPQQMRQPASGGYYYPTHNDHAFQPPGAPPPPPPQYLPPWQQQQQPTSAFHSLPPRPPGPSGPPASSGPAFQPINGNHNAPESKKGRKKGKQPPPPNTNLDPDAKAERKQKKKERKAAIREQNKMNGQNNQGTQGKKAKGKKKK